MSSQKDSLSIIDVLVKRIVPLYDNPLDIDKKIQESEARTAILAAKSKLVLPDGFIVVKRGGLKRANESSEMLFNYVDNDDEEVRRKKKIKRATKDFYEHGAGWIKPVIECDS